MNIQRFTAPTSREALAKARAVFGEGTLILSNRATPTGVEVMATAEDALESLQAAAEDHAAAARPSRPAPQPKAAPAPAPNVVEADTEQLAMSTLSFQDYVRERMLRRRHEASVAAQQPATQTRRAQVAAPLISQVAAQVAEAEQVEAKAEVKAEAAVIAEPKAQARAVPVAKAAAAKAVFAKPAPVEAPIDFDSIANEIAAQVEMQTAAVAKTVAKPVEQVAPAAPAAPVVKAEPVVEAAAVEVVAAPVVEAPVVQAPVAKAIETPVVQAVAAEAPVEVKPAPVAAPAAAPVIAPIATRAAVITPDVLLDEPAPQVANQQGITNQLQAMKALIDERFNTLAWLGETRQDPIRANLTLKLIRAGYSPVLARAVLDRLPDGSSPGEAMRWLTSMLERNLRTDTPGLRLLDEGGVFALVGATGVGKTTTVAKLAALSAQEHGAASVGLITLDTQRIGAHDQLREHGRQFGIVAHQAHDRAALQELLNLFANRHMVLIDTSGVAPSDPRMKGMLDMLDLPGLNRLLVMNAGMHGDTLDSVLTAFKGSGTQHAILSKIDEAAKLGPALDTLIRHQFVLRGVTNGQRVPEDWMSADAPSLIRQSMRAPARSVFEPRTTNDLNFFFAPDSGPSMEEALQA